MAVFKKEMASKIKDFESHLPIVIDILFNRSLNQCNTSVN